jgi:ParB-like chromosome segregation protein Spo0J
MAPSRQTHPTARPSNHCRRHAADAGGVPSTSSAPGAQSKTGRSKQGWEDEVALLERVRQRLRIAAPLRYHRVHLPIDQLVVRDVTPAMRRDAHLLAANLKLVGLVNPPSVLPLPTGTNTEGDDRTHYEVFLGRRRVLAAQELSRKHHLPGWDHLWCHVYEVPDDPARARRMRALLTLSENGCRSPAWVEELRRLVEFLEHPVPLTDQELWTVLGISPSEAKARLKLARLPRPILEQVFAGAIASQALLHRVARLTHEQQNALAERAAAADLITPALVDRALRGQIDCGLAVPVLQASLSQSWDLDPPQLGACIVPPIWIPSPNGAQSANVPPAPPVTNAPATAAQNASAASEQAQSESSVARALLDALRLLRTLLPMLAGEPRLMQARLLAEALLHELEPEALRYAQQRHEPTNYAA